MSELPGDVVISFLEGLISTTKVPIELSSSSWNSVILDWMKIDLTNCKLKVDTVKVMQCYSRRWREELPHLNVSRSLPLYVGSYAEGMPNSADCDVMYILKLVHLYEFEGIFRKDGLPMSSFDCPPGYVRIIIPAFIRNNSNGPQYRKYGKYYYLTNFGFLEVSQSLGATGALGKILGPAMRETSGFSYDLVHAIRCEKWPSFANDFFKRRRKHHLPLDQIQQMETYVVATSTRNSASPDLDWRLSFTNAEKFLVECWGYTEKCCYHLLKQFKSYILSDQDIVCSYYLKTVIFWMCDVLPQEFWREENTMKSYVLALTILIHFLKKCEIPNYFIPENNMIDHKDKEECRKIGKLIEDKLAAGQMNVLLVETFNEEPISYVFESIGRPFCVGKPIRSNKAFEKYIARFEYSGRSPQQRRLEQEASLLSSLSATNAVWNEEQYRAMADTLEHLKYNVSAEFVTPFSVILKRKLGDFLHKVGLRSSLQKAEALYKEALDLIYPSGFNDSRVSGVTYLALYYYLNSQIDMAINLLLPTLTFITTVIDVDYIECYLTVVLPVYKADRFWRDKILYTAVKNTTPETPIKVNSIVLALYIYLRCLCDPCRKMDTLERNSLRLTFRKFADLANHIQQDELLASFRLLYEGVNLIVQNVLSAHEQLSYPISKTQSSSD